MNAQQIADMCEKSNRAREEAKANKDKERIRLLLEGGGELRVTENEIRGILAGALARCGQQGEWNSEELKVLRIIPGQNCAADMAVHLLRGESLTATPPCACKTVNKSGSTA